MFTATLITINDHNSFSKYNKELNRKEDINIMPSLSTSTSNSMYGVYNETFGWIKEIQFDSESEELKLSFTESKQNAMAVKGCDLSGRILTWGLCIPL